MVFTCVTDTGRLKWDINNQIQSFHSPMQLNIPVAKDIFITVLRNVSVVQYTNQLPLLLSPSYNIHCSYHKLGLSQGHSLATDQNVSCFFLSDSYLAVSRCWQSSTAE